MKVVESELGKVIIENYLTPEILALNPIVAGGFVVGIYFAAIRYSSKRFDADLKNRLILDKFLNKDFHQISDIDLWFHSQNEIWSKDHAYHLLIADETAEKLREECNQFQSAQEALAASNPVKLPTAISYFKSSGMIKSLTEEYPINLKLKDLGVSSLKKSTHWANTFNSNKIAKEIQIIKKPYSNIDALFSHFDFANCCAAYYDGKFYFSDDFDDHYDNGILKVSNLEKNKTCLSKLFSAERAFKYSSRYCLEFETIYIDELVKLFLDTDTFYRKLLNRPADEKVDLGIIPSAITDNDPYGRVMELPAFLIRTLIDRVLNNFYKLVKMKGFDRSNLLYFMDSGHTNIKYTIQSSLILEKK